MERRVTELLFPQSLRRTELIYLGQELPVRRTHVNNLTRRESWLVESVGFCLNAEVRRLDPVRGVAGLGPGLGSAE